MFYTTSPLFYLLFV